MITNSILKLIEPFPSIPPLENYWRAAGYCKDSAQAFSVLVILPLDGSKKSKSNTPTLALTEELVDQLSAQEKLKHKYVEAEIGDNQFLAFYQYFLNLGQSFHYLPIFMAKQLKYYINNVEISEASEEDLRKAFNKKARDFERLRCVAQACKVKELAKVFGTDLNTSKKFIGNLEYTFKTKNRYNYKFDQKFLKTSLLHQFFRNEHSSGNKPRLNLESPPSTDLEERESTEYEVPSSPKSKNKSKKQELKANQYAKWYVIANPIWVSHVLKDRASLSRNENNLYDLCLFLANIYGGKDFRVSNIENGNTTVAFRLNINYNHGDLAYDYALDYKFLSRKVDYLDLEFEVPYIIDQKELSKITLDTKFKSSFNNFTFEQGRNHLLKYLLRDTKVLSNEATYSYTSFDQHSLDKEFIENLHQIKKIIPDFSISKVNVNFPIHDTYYPSRLIGCQNSSPFILTEDFVEKRIFHHARTKVSSYSDLSDFSKLFIFSVATADRGRTPERTHFFSLPSGHKLIFKNDKEYPRLSIISNEIFDLKVIKDALKNTSNKKARNRFYPQLLVSNACRHFGCFVINNRMKFDNNEQRVLFLKLYLSHEGYVTGNKRYLKRRIKNLTILSEKFLEYFKGLMS